jgi:hypothetical protein
MKNVIICVLIGAMAVSGVLYYQQSQKAWGAQNRVAELEKKLAELEEKNAKQQEKTADLRAQLLNSKVEAVSKANEVEQLQSSITNSAKGKSDNPFAGMFKDPAMKEMIKTQQQTVMGPMIEMMYSGLITNLNLSPEQSAALKDLLTKRQMIDSQAGVSLLGDDLDADKRKALMDQAKADKDAINAQIKQTIGDAGYTQLDAWDKSAGDRMMLNTFKSQLGASAPAMSSDQEGQLMQALSEERGKFKFTTDFGDQSALSGGDWTSMFTDEKVSQFSAESTQLMQNYLSRAQSILSPDQYKIFEGSLNSQQQMQTVGLKMAVKMFGGK